MVTGDQKELLKEQCFKDRLPLKRGSSHMNISMTAIQDKKKGTFKYR
jgi:hypothetical protein